MNRGIYPILSGALAQERQMQVFSNNVANVNTAGFKQDESMFRSLMARSMGNASSGEFDGTGLRIGARPEDGVG